MPGGSDFSVPGGKAQSRLILGSRKIAHVDDYKVVQRGLYCLWRFPIRARKLSALSFLRNCFCSRVRPLPLAA